MTKFIIVILGLYSLFAIFQNPENIGSIEENYVGGKIAFTNDFKNKLRHPEKSREMGSFGRVYFSISIDTMGNINEFEILKGIDSLINKEVHNKILMTNGNWKPCFIEGEKKPYKVVTTVYFELY